MLSAEGHIKLKPLTPCLARPQLEKEHETERDAHKVTFKNKFAETKEKEEI